MTHDSRTGMQHPTTAMDVALLLPLPGHLPVYGQQVRSCSAAGDHCGLVRRDCCALA